MLVCAFVFERACAHVQWRIGGGANPAMTPSSLAIDFGPPSSEDTGKHTCNKLSSLRRMSGSASARPPSRPAGVLDSSSLYSYSMAHNKLILFQLLGTIRHFAWFAEVSTSPALYYYSEFLAMRKKYFAIEVFVKSMGIRPII